ncbi:MAG: HypC/HybG/HupF family hydrogenase formation chaperone [Candidatus Sedimenticola sp. 6PFRAG5]
MCIGIPMQIIEQREFTALCRGRNGEQEVNTLLIGQQPEGTWILNFIGSAREVITEDDARKLESALDALDAVMRGEEQIDVETYFPDLADGSLLQGQSAVSTKKKNS